MSCETIVVFWQYKQDKPLGVKILVVFQIGTKSPAALNLCIAAYFSFTVQFI
jgi:hypothetical protein